MEQLRFDLDGKKVIDEEIEDLEKDLRTLRFEVIRSGETGVNLPVNLKRLIWNAQ